MNGQLSNKDLLKFVRPKTLPTDVQRSIKEIVNLACKKDYRQSIGMRLGALFDLFVSCLYYNGLANKGWTYCPRTIPMLLYAYTNVCPRCLGYHDFVFTKANKPESGLIGMATTEILCEVLLAYFDFKNRPIEIHKASEPIDVIIYDDTSKMMIISEVKAAPLLTIPLSLNCERLTEEIDGELINVNHNLCDNPFLHSSQPLLFFPATNGLPESQFQLQINWDTPYPFFNSIRNLCIEDATFLTYYFLYWQDAFEAYRDKKKDFPVFWLTNACGLPSPRPTNWPKRKNGGYETVSDAKTSVGMDRTDDIKKGIYQVLRLGAEYKPRYRNIKTALLSNIHAVRHQNEYLDSIKDIIWTIDATHNITEWSQLNNTTPLYNLFDGIISLIDSDIRDKEIASLFKF